ncbi:MAG: ferredoxin thioredoxin reductase catalytic beta chain [Lentisphaeria bacterium]|nr:ferredoxin thioredoxin reductase catalytic beta chain [Lentisphaeria bacterium]
MEKLPENVRFNPDKAYVEKLLQALEKKEGYCPCRLQKTPENLCICQEFRDQIADPEFEGFCHCKLYYKEK